MMWTVLTTPEQCVRQRQWPCDGINTSTLRQEISTEILLYRCDSQCFTQRLSVYVSWHHRRGCFCDCQDHTKKVATPYENYFPFIFQFHSSRLSQWMAIAFGYRSDNLRIQYPLFLTRLASPGDFCTSICSISYLQLYLILQCVESVWVFMQCCLLLQ